MMIRKSLTLGLAVLCLSTAVRADTPVSSDPGRSQRSEAQACCYDALTINFVKELGVPLEFLVPLGTQIAEARKAPDPVALALAAQSLGIAETISGKQASVTSEMVMQEALELVRMRGVSTELQAMMLIVTDEGLQAELAKELAAAQKREADARAAEDAGETTRELFGDLRVTNHTGECLRIYVSGRYVGEVHRGQTRYFHVHDHNHITNIDAFCEDGHLVRRGYVHGHSHGASWHIDP